MPSVLVVDDSAVDRRLVGGLLKEDAGFGEILFASNGREAMELLKEEQPSVVVTDLMMPEMDGFELVAAVNANYPSIPVVLMTGRGSEEIAVQALRAGAASYVPKNAIGDRLVETMRMVFDIAREKANHEALMGCLDSCEFCFELSNDAKMIPPLVDYLHRNIRSIGICDEVSAIRVCVALEEALNNAIFHGNLELESDIRDGNPAEYRKIVEERRCRSPFEGRSVRVAVRVTREMAKFVIRDEGRGFDPTHLPDPTTPENLERTCGRGILLMRTFMDEVEFNQRGNEVTLIKHRQNGESCEPV